MLKPVDEGGLLEGKMNIHAYTLDSLRKLIRRLQKENAELRLQLKNAYQTKTEASIFENNYEVEPEYDEDQGGRIISRYISADMATAFFTLFWGRQDVYAKRGRNGGYFPQCKNRWNVWIISNLLQNKLPIVCQPFILSIPNFIPNFIPNNIDPIEWYFHDN